MLFVLLLITEFINFDRFLHLMRAKPAEVKQITIIF